MECLGYNGGIWTETEFSERLFIQKIPGPHSITVKSWYLLCGPIPLRVCRFLQYELERNAWEASKKQAIKQISLVLHELSLLHFSHSFISCSFININDVKFCYYELPQEFRDLKFILKLCDKHLPLAHCKATPTKWLDICRS